MGNGRVNNRLHFYAERVVLVLVGCARTVQYLLSSELLCAEDARHEGLLAEAHDVWRRGQREVVVRPPAAGGSEARLNLVQNQSRRVLFA